MTNGTISGNTADSTLGRGAGIFVSGTEGAEAHFKLGNYGMVGLTNDVYLQNNVPIEIISSIDSTSANAARITPETYPSEDNQLELLTFASTSITKSYVAGKLEITPQTISGDQKQYWYINSDCKLAKRSGMGVSVTTIPTGLTDDMHVTVTSNGVTVQDNTTHLEGNSEITFTALDINGLTMQSYEWKLDGVKQSSTTKELTLNTTDWAAGTYEVYLEATAKDSNDKVYYYSYTAQIKISN